MTPGVLLYPQGSHQYRLGRRGLGDVLAQFSTTVSDVGQDPVLWQLVSQSPLPSPDSGRGGALGEMPDCPLEGTTTVSPTSLSCLLSPVLPAGALVLVWGVWGRKLLLLERRAEGNTFFFTDAVNRRVCKNIILGESGCRCSRICRTL